jgi:nucleolin
MGKKVDPKPKDDIKPIAFVKGKKQLEPEESSESDSPVEDKPKAVRKGSDSKPARKGSDTKAPRKVSTDSANGKKTTKLSTGKVVEDSDSSESEEVKAPAKPAAKPTKKPQKEESSSEEELPKKVAAKPAQAPAKPVPAKKAKLPSSSESESESEEETKKPVAPVKKAEPAKKAAPAKAAKAPSSDSESSEEEKKVVPTKAVPKKAEPAKKPAPKKGKQASDSESESSEEVKKPVKGKPAAKKPVASDDSSDEAVAPAKRAAAADSSEDSDDEPAKKPKTAPAATANKRKWSDDAASAPQKVTKTEGSTALEVFVGGLSYDASEEDITQLFSKYGEVTNLKCLTNQDGSFKGACFVAYGSNAEAVKATALNGTDHMGRTLKVNLANEKPPAARPDGGCNTVFVGNISFESTEDTIANFFSKCGAVAQVRLARGPDGGVKGFAHVEFESNEGADKAVTMAGQKLDGRPLRVDYAQAKGEGRGPSRRGGFDRGGYGGRRGGGFDDRGKDKMKKSGSIQPFQGQKTQL